MMALWIQGGDPKGNGTGVQSIWHGKDNTMILEQVLKMKFLHISIISVVLSMVNTGQPTFKW